MGTVAPCSTGFARIGVLRLGKSEGRMACNAMPMVWCSLLLDSSGVTSDWTTLRCPELGFDSEGDDGRYMRNGT